MVFSWVLEQLRKLWRTPTVWLILTVVNVLLVAFFSLTGEFCMAAVSAISGVACAVWSDQCRGVL